MVSHNPFHLPDSNARLSREDIASVIEAYLHKKISVREMVDWAENAVMSADLKPAESQLLVRALGRLGLADVRSFGLAWEDCQAILNDLGFCANVDVTSAK
jgi:hypothetical protein